MASVFFCTACGEHLPASARFCPACGAAKAAGSGARRTAAADGRWAHEEFSQSLRPYAGDYRYTAHVAAWQGALPGLPDGNMRDPIKRGVKALLDRVSRDGWEPVEPTDPDRLWEGGRIDIEYANDLIDTFTGTSRSARLIAVNINFRRWVPPGAKLPETSGSTSARLAREDRTRTLATLTSTAQRDKRKRVLGRVKRTLWWAALAGVLGVIVSASHLSHWREWVSADRTDPPGFLFLDMAANVALLIAVLVAAVAVSVQDTEHGVQEEPPWARRYVGMGGALALAAIMTLEIVFIVGPADDPFSDAVFGWGLLRFAAQYAAFVSALYLVRRRYGQVAAALILTLVVAPFVLFVVYRLAEA